MPAFYYPHLPLRSVDEMEIFGLFLWLWLLHAVFGAILAFPIIYFGRKRIHFQRSELLIFIIPFSIWAFLMSTDLSLGKSLANLGEPFYFVWGIPLAAGIRVMIGTRVPENRFAIALIVLVSIFAVIVFFATPPLPE